MGPCDETAVCDQNWLHLTLLCFFKWNKIDLMADCIEGSTKPGNLGTKLQP